MAVYDDRDPPEDAAVSRPWEPELTPLETSHGRFRIKCLDGYMKLYDEVRRMERHDDLVGYDEALWPVPSKPGTICSDSSVCPSRCCGKKRSRGLDWKPP